MSQFLDAVNLALGSEREVAIQGEVTDFKKGKWISFNLKDPEDGSLLKCVMGEWTWRRVGIELEDGMLVKVTGNAKINKKYGSFGMWVETVEPLGAGSLKKAYELLVKKLHEEGLFDRKRPIPQFIEHIGVISSKHGVVIKDFLNNLDKRGYNVHFIDTRVEGAEAVDGIVRALTWFNKKMPTLDALVVIRGGGSLESMQAFNNEAVARAVFGSKIPVIAGIGHDVDVPIAALVADLEESTPTGTAVAINASWLQLTRSLPLHEERLLSHFASMLQRAQNILNHASLSMKNLFARLRAFIEAQSQKLAYAVSSLGVRFNLTQERCTRLRQELSAHMGKLLESTEAFIDRSEQLLLLMNPERNLKLGYSIVRSGSGHVVRSTQDVKKGELLTTQVADGTIQSTITALQ